MGLSLDLRQAHLVRHHGQITVVYTWMRLPGEHEPERVMILMATHRSVKNPWFILREPLAHVYGSDDQELMLAAIRACNVLDLEPSRATAAKVASIILEGLPDLIEMPSAPDPTKTGQNLGAVQVRADGELIAERDVQPDDEGVSYGAA